MHLAAATGVPCVGIFGNFNRPESWHPMGHGHRVIHNMRGVDKISPDEVYGAVHDIMKDGSARANRQNFSFAIADQFFRYLIRRDRIIASAGPVAADNKLLRAPITWPRPRDPALLERCVSRRTQGDFDDRASRIGGAAHFD